MKSAGTEKNARIKVTQGHVGWADIIFVMEKKHMRRLQSSFGPQLYHKKVICLYIPDEYEYMDETLINELNSKVAEHLELPMNK